MIPGRVTQIALEPVRTGVFRGTCGEYCGTSHARMAFEVVVVERAEFEAWLASQAVGAQPVSTPIAARGARVFAAHGCTACHTIRGSREVGRIGPDLTHVGSRRRIGAGTLPRDPDAFVKWITEPERIKPGVHMPAFRMLTRDDLVALSAYLDGLQ
jgi:cytochrome c oxidase subunit II